MRTPFYRQSLKVLSIVVLVIISLHFAFASFSPAKADSNASKSESWAIIVGISDYAYLGDLNYCDDDAVGLYNQIAPSWGADHVMLLTDTEANKTDIHDAIFNWLAPVEDENDTVLFFFAGHGSQDSDVPPIDEADGYDEYLCPHDSLTASWANDISDDEFDVWLSVLDSGKIVVILDTCHSGGFIGTAAIKRVAINQTILPDVDLELGGLDDSFAKDISKTGRVILTSSAENEVSKETARLGHGIFSYYIIDALSKLEIVDVNANHEISAEEIFWYAEPRVVSFTENSTYKQHPQLFDGYDNELPLITTATITFDNNPWSVFLTVDGTTFSPTQLPISFTWATNTVHTFNVSSQVYEEIVENVSVESPHPYSNNYNNTWTLVRSDAARIRVHFNYIYTENNSDCVYILDNEGNVCANYTGNFTDLWSAWVIGDTIKTQLTSDSNVTYDGFAIDSLEWENQHIRHRFNSWNDGNTSTSRTLTALETQNYTATYITDYYLSVNSPYGLASGEGWYENGTTAYAILDTGVIDYLNGTQKAFANWYGHASGSNFAQSNAITMDGPKNASANWKTQHLISFAAAPSSGGSTSPAGTNLWKDAGSVSITATPNSGYYFSQWSTGTTAITFLNPSSSSTIATINGPGAITANFAVSPTPTPSPNQTPSPSPSPSVSPSPSLSATPEPQQSSLPTKHPTEFSITTEMYAIALFAAVGMVTVASALILRRQKKHSWNANDGN